MSGRVARVRKLLLANYFEGALAHPVEADVSRGFEVERELSRHCHPSLRRDNRSLCGERDFAERGICCCFRARTKTDALDRKTTEWKSRDCREGRREEISTGVLDGESGGSRVRKSRYLGRQIAL